MSPEVKATLSILIVEVLECKSLESVKEVTDSWVKANDLHPEEVNTMSTDQLQEYLKGSK